uniref:S-adenosylmethionine sensor upstream of mTORC1 n=1 Tax=Scapholeberis mucronata TaxID=202097 RepID=A0A4Y7NP76_9CRUS|nr:EOG090X0FUY [Scapholeberis mucronata]
MSNEAKVLAGIVKNVHRQLRKELKATGDPESVWLKHCQNLPSLKQYSKAMHMLATEYWEHLRTADPNTSRINWTWSYLIHYFHSGGLVKERSKSKLKLNWENTSFRGPKIKVLDVGSCYNPFEEYTELDVLPIDLCPALDSVYKCDFLLVPVTESTVIDSNSASSLAAGSFHCVVFSFFLEYLPSSSQRWSCCEKAQQLLVEEGILIIITPDSKAPHSNSKVMKSWREALASIGLKRIKYEKLQHAHCMAFRKLPAQEKEISNQPPISPQQMMYIPQDFNSTSDSDDDEFKVNTLHFTAEELVNGFNELPTLFDE